MPKSNWSSATIISSLALFVTYEARQGRWTLFWQAMGGRWEIEGSRNPNAPTKSSSGPTVSSGGQASSSLLQQQQGLIKTLEKDGAPKSVIQKLQNLVKQGK